MGAFACSVKIQEELQKQRRDSAPQRRSKILRIDSALATYYANCARDDYLNEHKNGKFAEFMAENLFDDSNLDQILDINNCILAKMDVDFPLPMLYADEHLNESIRKYAMFQVILHCYENGKPPSHAFSRQKRKETIIKSSGHKACTYDQNALNDLEKLLSNNHNIKDRALLLDCLYVYGQMTKNKKCQNVSKTSTQTLLIK
eukprot:UN11705